MNAPAMVSSDDYLNTAVMGLHTRHFEGNCYALVRPTSGLHGPHLVERNQFTSSVQNYDGKFIYFTGQLLYRFLS